MLNKFKIDEWEVIEEDFEPGTSRLSESIFSLGNEHMGLRGFFEEKYSGDSLQGTYIAGIYYPDKTRVGWWKVGYPEYFAKVINSINWIGVDIEINGKALDLAKCRTKDFRRVLNMKEGRLTRSFIQMDEDGNETAFVFSRFLSMADRNIACISVKIVPLNYSGDLVITSYLDGDVSNEDSNYNERFWDEVSRNATNKEIQLTMKTRKTDFLVSASTAVRFLVNSDGIETDGENISRDKYAGQKLYFSAQEGDSIELQKYVAVCTSRDFGKESLEEETRSRLRAAYDKGYTRLSEEHVFEMARLWERCDVVIEGDLKAQQGIRYNIFQLMQTYNGTDPRLNIGPKGFTGEKYGGVTYWDTEAFCFPFYLYTDERVARNLLHYRYMQLEKARENAAKLGLKGALYPMVTINGEECHNEWEITFEEIHRNGAIAYAIYNYTNFTDDKSYLFEKGIDVLIEISRFWACRVNYSSRIDRYMMLGVTGPNEYENNVNNNWYTNLMASWTLKYTCDCLKRIHEFSAEMYEEIVLHMGVDNAELSKWEDIAEKMYFPFAEDLGIFVQNDGYLDKVQDLVRNIAASELPLNKHWSWDRILRSCFIKQADVVQGLYFFPDRFDMECQRCNFDFYEPRTVHESSLSPSIHSIVASRIGYREKAYELYLRTARLDLDNYNDDTDDGVHLTSMAASWSSIVEGFAGLKISGGYLTLNPYIPAQWKGYAFKLEFRGRKLKIILNADRITIEQFTGNPLEIFVYGRKYVCSITDKLSAAIKEFADDWMNVQQ